MIRRPRSRRNSRSRFWNSAFGLSVALCAGLCGCVTSGVPLDEAAISILIREDGDQAEIDASVRDRNGASLALDEGQTIEVNDVELDEGAAGELDATIEAAAAYEIVVREPTRGVFRDTVGAPDALVISEPDEGDDVSLSGFTLTWPAEDGARVVVTLRQTLLGSTERATFGPLDDAGELELSAADLQEFRQGADLEITIDRVTADIALDNLDDAIVAFEQTAVVRATPAP